MSRLESAKTIEAKVGAPRHPTAHLGRAVSITERVYVLHSAACVASGMDLRKCEYSVALDLGIDLHVWNDYQDMPVVLGIDPENDDLIPMRDIQGIRLAVNNTERCTVCMGPPGNDELRCERLAIPLHRTHLVDGQYYLPFNTDKLNDLIADGAPDIPSTPTGETND